MLTDNPVNGVLVQSDGKVVAVEAVSRDRIALERYRSKELDVLCAPGYTELLDIQFTNTAQNDFDGNLMYFDQAPESGCVGKQYGVVKRL